METTEQPLPLFKEFTAAHAQEKAEQLVALMILLDAIDEMPDDLKPLWAFIRE